MDNALPEDARNGFDDGIERRKREWLASVPVEDADALLFRFETTIRALDRFFNLQNHPHRRSGHVSIGDDLRIEIQVADRFLRQLLQWAQSVLDETDTSAFVFRSYVETELVSDSERDQLLARHLQQETPLESLYLLQIGLRSLVQLSSGLLAADHVSLNPFRALGHQYTSMILQNRYFNPLKSRQFNVVYDRVEHPLLQHAVRDAPSEEMRRALSVLILTLNRYLRVLGWLRPDAALRDELYDALPYLALLRSDFRTLIPYLEVTLPRRFFPNGATNEAEAALLERVDAFAFQLSLESRKVFEQLLLDFSQTTSTPHLRSGLEATQGLLHTFLQQTVVLLINTVLPDVEGKDIFTDFISRREQSRKLREDIWIFHELLKRMIALFGDEDATATERRRRFDGLLAFLTYFVEASFQLVRAADHEAFANFISGLQRLEQETFDNPARAREVGRSLEHFRIFLETTLSHINQRADLHDVPFDEAHARSLLNRFWQEDTDAA
ncbi:MAG: hypothetical protein D6761_10050 [Candidatus Dadabacteria bacterium]|nr:MAG: hypothetical protein D6761_10050 [Candidatus Dadabacteria bacterium]